jgi:hypothetical protein
MNNYIIVFIILFMFVFFGIYLSKSGFVNYVLVPAWHRCPFWRRRWARGPWGYRPYAWRYWREGFENASSDKKFNSDNDNENENENENENIMNYELNGPAATNKLYNLVPYHLLSDEYNSPSTPEKISDLNSQECYSTDFQKLIEKTGNFAQLTNNYKRQYPDSCSGTPHELVSSFYKVDSMIIGSK